MPNEVELKLALSEAHQARFLRHPLLKRAIERHREALDNIYYDTQNLSLRQHGIALRLRRKGPTWLQTVKLAGSAAAGLSSRPEWETPYGGHFDFSHLEPESLRIWMQRPGLLARIVPVCETRFRRITWKIPCESGFILVTLDRGWVIADGRREPISEVELELDGAPVQALFTIAGELAQRVALTPAVLSKAERGYRLHSGKPASPVKAVRPALDTRSPPFEAFRTIALSCLEHLQQNHVGALNTQDVEYIHQMRVATRRFRAALRLFSPILPPSIGDMLRTPMATLTRQLGQARDLDVLLGEIVGPVQQALPDEPRLAALGGEITNLRYNVRHAVLATLAAPGYGQMLLASIATLHPQSAPGDGGTALARFAGERLGQLCRRVRRLSRHADTADPVSLHALRIGIKRLRYGLEFFSGAHGRRHRRVQEMLASAQDVLGQLNDLANAGQHLTSCAGHDPQLREAVTLVGGWHAPRHAHLLEDISALLPKLAHLRLPTFSLSDNLPAEARESSPWT